MKKLLIVVCLTHTLFSTDLVTRYQVDPEVKQILDDHINEVKRAFKKNGEGCIKKGKVYEFSWLPGYIIKGQAKTRIRGLEKMRSSIRKHNLDLLMVPDKRVYHIPGKPKKFTDHNYLLVIPKYHTQEGLAPFTLEQTQQIWAFVLKSGYGDFKPNNYFRVNEDQLVVIDTEWHTFASNKRFKNLARLIFDSSLVRYDEESIIFMMEHLVPYLPRHNLDSCSNRHPYRRIYSLMKSRLQEQGHHFGWDTLGFFKKYFPARV